MPARLTFLTTLRMEMEYGCNSYSNIAPRRNTVGESCKQLADLPEGRLALIS
jgi:hypothetical protein